MATTQTSSGLTTGLVWLTRATWIGFAAVAPDPVGRWLAGTDAPTSVSWAVWAFAAVVWLIGVVALVFPSVTTLTVARTTIPFAAVATAAMAIARPDPTSVIASGLAVATMVGISSADFGRGYAQASAYGDEERFLLRPPPVYLALCAVVWAAAVASTLAAIVALPHHALVAIVAAALAVATWAWGWRRWHRLSRRWAVLVPAGLVLHDHLVLAETMMISRADLSNVGTGVLDADNVGAFDLTGGARGGRVVFTTRSSVTVLLAANPAKPTGTAIHLTAAVIAPTRPGRFIARLSQATGARTAT